MPRLKGYRQRGGTSVYGGYNPNQEGGVATRSRLADAEAGFGLPAGTLGKTLRQKQPVPQAFRLNPPPKGRQFAKGHTDADAFLQMTGMKRKGNGNTLWHSALVPFQLHGPYAGRLKRGNKYLMMAYALWQGHKKMLKGKRDPEYAKILSGTYNPLNDGFQKWSQKNNRKGRKKGKRKGPNIRIVKGKK